MSSACVTAARDPPRYPWQHLRCCDYLLKLLPCRFAWNPNTSRESSRGVMQRSSLGAWATEPRQEKGFYEWQGLSGQRDWSTHGMDLPRRQHFWMCPKMGGLLPNFSHGTQTRGPQNGVVIIRLPLLQKLVVLVVMSRCKVWRCAATRDYAPQP